MVAYPAQIRLALYDMRLLDTVEQIVALDPRAGIVWEHAQAIERTSPFIDALQTNDIRSFTEEEIDDIFAAAMATVT